MEDEFKKKLMQKFAEDERLEQKDAQKRRMREQEHKREIERLWKGAELGITDRLARKLQQGRMRCGNGVERGS